MLSADHFSIRIPLGGSHRDRRQSEWRVAISRKSVTIDFHRRRENRQALSGRTRNEDVYSRKRRKNCAGLICVYYDYDRKSAEIGSIYVIRESYLGISSQETRIDLYCTRIARDWTYRSRVSRFTVIGAAICRKSRRNILPNVPKVKVNLLLTIPQVHLALCSSCDARINTSNDNKRLTRVPFQTFNKLELLRNNDTN